MKPKKAKPASRLIPRSGFLCNKARKGELRKEVAMYNLDPADFVRPGLTPRPSAVRRS